MSPKSVRPCTPPLSGRSVFATPSGKDRAPAGRLNSTQWVNTPLGASGSSMISANDCVPSGTSLQERAGETSSPSQVNRVGIGWSASNASLRTAKAMTPSSSTGVSVTEGVSVGVPFPPPQAAMSSPTASKPQRTNPIAPLKIARRFQTNLLALRPIDLYRDHHALGGPAAVRLLYLLARGPAPMIAHVIAIVCREHLPRV